MTKPALDINYQGLIYLTDDGDTNHVPSILGDVSFDYHYPSIDYEYESCYMGFLNEEIAYKDFASLEKSYAEHAVEEFRVKYIKASDEKYFISTSHLIKEYKAFKEAYESLKASGKKINYDKDPAKGYLRFADNHKEIIKDLDIRFSHLGYYLAYDNPKDGVMGALKTFEPNPDIDYLNYLLFLDEFYKFKSKEIRRNKEDDIKGLKFDYQSLINDLKKLLKDHEKAGIVYLTLSMPKRLISQDIGSLKDLTIDTYLKLEPNKIYYIKKDQVMVLPSNGLRELS